MTEVQAPLPPPLDGPARSPLDGVTLRVARPTGRLDALVRFYRDGLGLDELARFEDHDGFDGVMLGALGTPYHLEFTCCRRARAGAGDGSPASEAAPGPEGRPAPGQADGAPEHLLVFYLPDRGGWEAAVDRLRRQGHDPVPSANPYWDRRGLTFCDPDGYRVVLQNAGWAG